VNPKLKLALSITAAVIAFYLPMTPVFLRLGIVASFGLVIPVFLFVVGLFVGSFCLGFAVEAIRDIWKQERGS